MATIKASTGSHKVASAESDEDFFCFGRRGERLADYSLVGWHGSDSGLTCLIDESNFAEGNREDCGEVDQLEFTLATLEDPELERDLEEFPLYLWFSRIPGGASSVRVYGIKSGGDEFDGILLRAGEDDLIDNDSVNEQTSSE